MQNAENEKNIFGISINLLTKNVFLYIIKKSGAVLLNGARSVI